MKATFVSDLKKEFNHNLFMYIPLTIILQSCLGSVAAMMILAQGTTLISGIELTLCVVLCMVYNAALLAQLKSDTGFWLLMASLAGNSVLILINLI
jgi:hypothetical protein